MRMRGKRIFMALLTLAAGAEATAPATGLTHPATDSGYQLTAQIPSAFQKGQNATLVLHVKKDGQSVDPAAVCLSPRPLFISFEDAADPTPAGGADLGTGLGTAPGTGCSNALAGEQTGPGTYAFTWEPDTAGRVNLMFTAGSGTLTVPVDVGSAPPSTTVLILFAVFVAAVLITAAGLRARLERIGAAS